MLTTNSRNAGSSSTTRIVSSPRAKAPALDAGSWQCAGGAAAAWAGLEAPGKKRVKVEPAPSWLSTITQPWCCLTIPYTVASPSPVPLPGSLVVKNGSNKWLTVAGLMPQPVSATLRRTKWPGRASGLRIGANGSRVCCDVARVSFPPSGMASRALRTRFLQEAPDDFPMMKRVVEGDEDGFPILLVASQVPLVDRVIAELGKLIPGRDINDVEVEIVNELKRKVKGYDRVESIREWLENVYFDFHASLYKSRPIFWDISSKQGKGPAAFSVLSTITDSTKSEWRSCEESTFETRSALPS